MYCSNIESINVNDNIYAGLFEQCTHSDISVIACDTKNVTNMACMFYGCIHLEKLDISIIDTKNVTDMSYMFYDCKNIKNLDISNFDVKNVNKIYSMFGNCKNLETLNFKVCKFVQIPNIKEILLTFLTLKLLMSKFSILSQK